MLSWKFQQGIRRIKEKFAALVRSKNFLIAIAFIALFIASLYINTYTARVIESKEKTEEQLSLCQENLTACEENATIFQQLLSACVNSSEILQSNFSLCLAEKEKLVAQYKNVSFDLASCLANYSTINKVLEQLNTSFEKLANSSATNICCKRKIDEPSLRYFYVKDGVLYCTSEFSESLGTKQFTCPSLAS
jgi:hypothetical protein